MEELIRKANNLKKELDTYRPFNDEVEGRVMQKFKLDWNFHSNNLEGNSLTYGETKALILHGITAQGKPLKDHFEITGHNEAIEWVLEIVKGDRPMTESFIRQFHTILLKKPYEVDAITPDGKPTKKVIHVGEYKTTPNHVKTKTGELFYFASVEETPAKMEDLISWYRKNEDKIDPIILAAEFHYRFIRIHPFDDGNGRVARLLMNFILMKHDFAPVIIRTDDKENYFSALQQADAGIIEPFIKYVAQNLILSLSLILRAVQGENIEDIDDGLKEFKLMQKKLGNIGKAQEEQAKYASVLLIKSVDDILFPVFQKVKTDFLPRTSELMKRFLVKVVLFNFHEDQSEVQGKPMPKTTSAQTSFQTDSILGPIKEGKYNACQISFSWGALRHVRGISCKVNLEMNFQIRNSGVLIRIQKDREAKFETFEKDLSKPLSEEKLEKFNSYLLSAVVAQIDAQLPK